MSDALRIYDVDSRALEAEHPFSGEIISAGREVLLVMHYEEGGDEQSYALVDMASGELQFVSPQVLLDKLERAWRG